MEGGGDHVVATRLRAGDETALAEVYDAHASVVFGLARRITGDAVAAEDLTQDVLVWLWQHPEAFDPARGSLRSFLATVARRRAIDWVRSAAARRRREDGDSSTSPDPPDPADVIATAALHAEVGTAVEDLPEPQREALVLAYYSGLTYREVAARLDIPEGTAKSRLRSALATLATRLREEGDLAR